VPDVPDDLPLTPDERRREVARILARGVLRLRGITQAAAICATPEALAEPADSPQEEVDVCATTRPHGCAG
jgi:hypothetical protein